MAIGPRSDTPVDLGVCIVSQNLNLLVLRGQAPLDVLARISDADVYDSEINKDGPQRPLDGKHAEAFLNYALESLASDPATFPCLVPEVLLNLRDSAATSFYEPQDPNRLVSFDSLASDAPPPSQLGVRIDPSRIVRPSRPGDAVHISRVDGNHRLAGADSFLRIYDEARASSPGEIAPEYPEFPILPFAMLVGLPRELELKLFRDLNGEHRGMDTSHLDGILLRISADLKKSTDLKQRALWLAGELTKQERAFSDTVVYMGGSKAGLKAAGKQPVLKISQLKSAQLKLLEKGDEVTRELLSEPDALLELVDRYWRAVKNVFPREWADKKGHILMQTIGLDAFAMFGGRLIQKLGEPDTAETPSVEFFETHLNAVAQKVSLRRDDWKGIAGGGGTRQVFDKIVASAPDHAVVLAKMKAALVKPSSISDKLSTSTDETTL